jgi:hypothetical protein
MHGVCKDKTDFFLGYIVNTSNISNCGTNITLSKKPRMQHGRCYKKIISTFKWKIRLNMKINSNKIKM